MAGENKGGSVQHVPTYGTLSNSNRSRAHSTNNASNAGYTLPKGGHNKPSVFDFSVKTGICPTCQGTGRITKAHRDQLVAIIPYSDKRLKRPRRWCCYFAVFLLLMIAAAAIILGLLFPRELIAVPVHMVAGNWTHIKPTNSTKFIVLTEQVHMGIDVNVHLTNPNYAPVTVNTMNVSVYHDTLLVGKIKEMSIQLGARTDRSVYVYCKFSGAEASKVKFLCDQSQKWKNQLMLHFEVVTAYTYIGSKSQTEAMKYQYVQCMLKPIRSPAGTLSANISPADT